jgi:hypothetical protein
MLLKGIDFFRAHKAVYYKKVVTIQPLWNNHKKLILCVEEQT